MKPCEGMSTVARSSNFFKSAGLGLPSRNELGTLVVTTNAKGTREAASIVKEEMAEDLIVDVDLERAMATLTPGHRTVVVARFLWGGPPKKPPKRWDFGQAQ